MPSKGSYVVCKSCSKWRYHHVIGKLGEERCLCGMPWPASAIKQAEQSVATGNSKKQLHPWSSEVRARKRQEGTAVQPTPMSAQEMQKFIENNLQQCRDQGLLAEEFTIPWSQPVVVEMEEDSKPLTPAEKQAKATRDFQAAMSSESKHKSSVDKAQKAIGRAAATLKAVEELLATEQAGYKDARAVTAECIRAIEVASKEVEEAENASVVNAACKAQARSATEAGVDDDSLPPAKRAKDAASKATAVEAALWGHFRLWMEGQITQGGEFASFDLLHDKARELVEGLSKELHTVRGGGRQEQDAPMQDSQAAGVGNPGGPGVAAAPGAPVHHLLSPQKHTGSGGSQQVLSPEEAREMAEQHRQQ